MSEENENETTINDLPVELMELIISQLNPKSVSNFANSSNQINNIKREILGNQTFYERYSGKVRYYKADNYKIYLDVNSRPKNGERNIYGFTNFREKDGYLTADSKEIVTGMTNRILIDFTTSKLKQNDKKIYDEGSEPFPYTYINHDIQNIKYFKYISNHKISIDDKEYEVFLNDQDIANKNHLTCLFIGHVDEELLIGNQSRKYKELITILIFTSRGINIIQFFKNMNDKIAKNSVVKKDIPFNDQLNVDVYDVESFIYPMKTSIIVGKDKSGMIKFLYSLSFESSKFNITTKREKALKVNFVKIPKIDDYFITYVDDDIRYKNYYLVNEETKNIYIIAKNDDGYLENKKYLELRKLIGI